MNAEVIDQEEGVTVDVSIDPGDGAVHVCFHPNAGSFPQFVFFLQRDAAKRLARALQSAADTQ